MTKRVWTVLGVLAMLALATAAWAIDSGPKAGEGAPMLGIDAVNDDEAGYCVTCNAGMAPAVLAFVHTADDDTKALLERLEAKYAAHHEADNLHGAVIIVAEGDEADALKAFAADQEMTLPVAVVAPDSDSLKPWQLNSEAKNTVVLLKGHKVHASHADVTADDVTDEQLAELVG